MARIWLLVGCLAALGMAASAAQSPAPQNPLFTGNVAPMNDGDMQTARIRFAAGARTYWHVHERGQILLAESGRGQVQMRGGNRQELTPGKPIFSPGGVAHWHGAAPAQALTLAAVNFGGVKWLEAVSDAEYAGKKR
jgi:quercetin dioxygenase-like cupin family protein